MIIFDEFLPGQRIKTKKYFNPNVAGTIIDVDNETKECLIMTDRNLLGWFDFGDLEFVNEEKEYGSE